MTITEQETREKAEEILSDPRLTAEVVVAAIHALDVAQSADGHGKTPDGDGALMVVRNKLHFALNVNEPLREALR